MDDDVNELNEEEEDYEEDDTLPEQEQIPTNLSQPDARPKLKIDESAWCAVEGCHIKDTNYKPDGTPYKFISMPCDANRALEWQQMCRPGYFERDVKPNSFGRLVCERHFTSVDLELVLSNTPHYVAVYPTLHLPSKFDLNPPDAELQARWNKLQIAEIISNKELSRASLSLRVRTNKMGYIYIFVRKKVKYNRKHEECIYFRCKVCNALRRKGRRVSIPHVSYNTVTNSLKGDPLRNHGCWPVRDPQWFKKIRQDFVDGVPDEFFTESDSLTVDTSELRSSVADPVPQSGLPEDHSHLSSVDLSPDEAVRNFLRQQEQEESGNGSSLDIMDSVKQVENELNASYKSLDEAKSQCCQTSVREVKDGIDRLNDKIHTLFVLLDHMLELGRGNAPEPSPAFKPPPLVDMEASPIGQSASQPMNVRQVGGAQEEDPLLQVSKMFATEEARVVEWHSCDLCGKAFNKKRYMKSHRKLAHFGATKTESPEESANDEPGQQLECANCDKVFSTGRELKTHRLSEHEHERFPCSHCNSSYGRKIKLKYHLRDAHGILVENNADELRPVMQKGPAPKREPNTRSLLLGGPMPKIYKCYHPGCNKTFNCYNSLYSHRKTHGFAYQCRKCGQSFPNLAQRKHHTAVVHNKTKVFYCGYCTGEKAQMRNDPSLTNECKVCGQMFGSIDEMLDHYLLCRIPNSNESESGQDPQVSDGISVARSLLLSPGRFIRKDELPQSCINLSSEQLNDGIELLTKDGILYAQSESIFIKAKPSQIEVLQLSAYGITLEDYCRRYCSSE